AMLLRVVALWNRSLPIKVIMTFLCVFNTLFYVVSGLTVFIKGDSGVPQDAPFTGCQSRLRNPQPPLYAVIIPGLVFETFVVFFTIIRSYPLVALRYRSPNSTDHMRSNGTLARPVDASVFRLWSLLFNDGILYYLVVMLAQVINIYAAVTIETTTSVSLPILLSQPVIMVQTIACNRLFLRLHANMTQGAGDVITPGTAGVTAGTAGTGLPGRSYQLAAIRREKSQLKTADYDYHAYLREDVHKRKEGPVSSVTQTSSDPVEYL
ncbi:hypothetical protein FRC17_008734, partial [Serendipita sp. 399]